MELIFSPNIMDAVRLTTSKLPDNDFKLIVNQIAKDVTASLGVSYGEILKKILDEYPEIEAELIPYEQFVKSKLERVKDES